MSNKYLASITLEDGLVTAVEFLAIAVGDLPLATNSSKGIVQPDGTTITISGGVISSAAGGDMLANFVNSANALSNPSAAALAVNTWNVVTATSACNAKLPTPTAGHVVGVRIDPSSTNLFTLNPHSSESIDGYSSRIMWAGESAVLVSDGTNWYKVAGKTIPMAARVYLNSGQTCYQYAATQINLDTAASDNTGGLMTANVSSTHAITIARPGTYLMFGQVIFKDNNSGVFIGWIWLNAENNNLASQALSIVGSPYIWPNPGPSCFAAGRAAGDNILLGMYQTASASDTLLTGSPYTFLTVQELPSW